MAEQEANGGLGRPLPHFDPASTTPTKQDEVQDSDDDGGSGGGRRHVSASVSKTSFSADTPASQKRAIQSLKQSLTFSDNSSHSSAASTPQKTGATQSGQGSTHSLQSSTQSAPPTFGTGRPVAVRDSEPVDEGEGSEYISEGEIPAEISITAIMSKLEQVKSYLQEAQALHLQMKERLSEPGMAVQVNKMGRLVEDLRRQESGYLSILVKLLDQQQGGPVANSSQVRTAENEDLREVLSDGEVSGDLVDEVAGGEKGNDSMSLKAELLKERMETQYEEREKKELMMLREQRDLLRKLVEQQKQIEALEVRQKRSLLLDGDTTGHPPATTTNTQAPPSGPGMLGDGAGKEKQEARVTTESVDDETTESAVVRRLQQLRERRTRVEQLTSLLQQLHTDTENERESQVPTLSAVAAAAGNTGQPQGGGELVAVGSQAMPAELLELHQKLRQAQEAREKLAELQQMISLLQEPDVEGEVSQHPPPIRQGLLTRESQLEQQQQQQQQQHGEEEEEDGEDGQTESGGELEASVILEYEERLVRRRREVRELQEQRDRLLATQRKLQQLHQSIADTASLSPTQNTASATREQSVNAPSNGGAEGVLSSEELASELGRQRRLYDELLDKTHQIQSMVDEVTGARDMSGATWGGSSSEEEEEEGVSSVTGLNDTRDDLEHTFTGTLGGSAVMVVEEDEEEQRDGGRGGGEGEEMVFRVTRHTPHHLRGGQRRLLTPETMPHSAGKRMKLDDTSSAAPALTAQAAAGSVKAPPQPSTKPAIGSLSAAWPGVIFPSSSSRKQTREEATQTGRDVMGQESLAETHLSFLHHQLAATSSLASQLLVSQQTLVGSVCRQLETQQLAGCFQDHFSRLHHYQTQLEHHYQQLQAAFYKLEVAAGEREEEENDEEDEELDRYREEPVLQARPPSPQPPFTSTTLPPPDTPQSSNTRGRPSEPANEKRERADFEQSPTEPGPTMSGSQTRQSDRRRSSFFRMPPPPGAYLPHLYQPVPPDRRDPEREEEGESVDDGVAAGFFPPPPPLPPYFHPHPFPYYYPPPPPPHHLYPPWVPPTPHLGGHNMSFPHLQTSTSFNAGPSVSPLPSHPNPYPNFRLYPGVAPVYPGHAPYDSFFGLNSSGHHVFGPSYLPPHMGGHIGGGGGYEGVLRGVTREGGEQHQRPVSLSGVTGVSMQVQPPSSPPSAPSVTNLPQTSLAGPNTGSGLLPQSTSGTLLPPAPTSVSQTRAPSSSLPKLTTLTSHSNHHTLTGSASSPHPLQSVPQSWGGVQRSGQGGGKEGEGGERKKVAGSLVQPQDDESLSSLPLSLPDGASKRETRGEGGEGERAPEDFSVFDALRDTIYSEVATLIANNENRPHFLVELFRELQMLSSDYLRQRALYSLQDLVTRYLTEEGLQGRGRGRNTAAPGLECSWSEQTPSESLVTSDDDEFGRASVGGERERREEEEEEEEGSPQSTPPRPRGKAPSVSGLAGDTVVRLDKAITRLRESYGSSGTMQPPVVSPGPLQKQPHINTDQLDQQIKAIMTEVIPLLKGHMAKSCSPELLQEIRQLVMKLTLTQLKIQGPSSVETFCKQLDTALENALQKYLNQMLKECGEALLVEVSEVLFNELAFFRLAQTMEWKNEPGLGSAPKPSQSEEVEGREGEVDGEEERGAEVLPVLQALTAAVEKSLSEEQEALGKTRDDELAREWNGPQDGPSSPSLEEDQTIIVELSASESKPIESVGSGEEREGNEEEGENPAKNTGGREETPPTPVIAAVTGTGTAALSTQSPPPPDLSTYTKVDIQMKLELASTGGIAGILASVEQEPELARESDQLPEPTGPSEAVAEP